MGSVVIRAASLSVCPDFCPCYAPIFEPVVFGIAFSCVALLGYLDERQGGMLVRDCLALRLADAPLIVVVTAVEWHGKNLPLGEAGCHAGSM
jgi:hypothetical protein